MDRNVCKKLDKFLLINVNVEFMMFTLAAGGLSRLNMLINFNTVFTVIISKLIKP